MSVLPPLSAPSTPPEDIELGEVFRRLRPFALWIGLATASATAGIYLYSHSQPRVYESALSLMSVSGSGSPGLPFSVSAPPVTPSAVEEVLHSSELVEDIIRRLPATSLAAPEIRALSADLRAEVKSRRFGRLLLRSQVDQQQRGIYEIRARAGNGQTAKTLAGLSARSLLAWDQDRARRRYTRARQSLEAQLGSASTDASGNGARAQLVQNIWELRLLESSAAGTLTLVSQPVTPEQPLAPRPSRDAALAGLLALLASSGMALLVHRWRRRVRSSADLKALNLPVLGELPLPVQRRPSDLGPVAASRTGSLQGALGYLRLQLLPLLAASPHPTVVVCGTLDAQGASGVVAALAAHLGASGLKVLVIDAQVGSPHQRRFWPVHVAPWHPLPGAQVNLAYGVATTLAQACLNPQVAQVARVSSCVDVLPADESSARDPLLSPVHQASFPSLLRRWSSAYDVVLVDAPPLLTVSDALAAAPGTAGLLLVADTASVRVPELEQALKLAATTAIPVLGCVLTRPGRSGPSAEQLRRVAPGRSPDHGPEAPHAALGPSSAERHPTWTGQS